MMSVLNAIMQWISAVSAGTTTLPARPEVEAVQVVGRAAQTAAPAARHVGPIYFWSAILVAAILVLFVGLWFYRKRYIQMEGGSNPKGTPWTFEDLVRMKAEGQISAEEYASLRAAMVAALTGRADAKTTGAAPSSAGSAGGGLETGWDWVADDDPPQADRD